MDYRSSKLHPQPSAAAFFDADFSLAFDLQLKKNDLDEDISKDWKFAAMVVDRLCLIIFTLFTIIATLSVLFSAPNFLI